MYWTVISALVVCVLAFLAMRRLLHWSEARACKRYEDEMRQRGVQEEEERRKRRAEAKKNYPVMELTQSEYDKIPSAAGHPKEVNWQPFFYIVPLGYRFKCRDDESIIGVVVKGDDMIADQWGAGLCVPERGINRYRVKIVEEKKTETVTSAS